MALVLSNLLRVRIFPSSCMFYSKAVKGPDIVLKEKEWQLTFYQKNKGKIYDKKPFRVTLQEGKQYIWCACGHSKHQPMCDGTHLIQQLKIKQKPIVFRAPKTFDAWLCNCKQTKNPPFCDGTHRDKHIQAAKKD